MAVKAYRDRGRSMGIKHPEIILSVSAHPAFEKAADYFGLKVIRVEMDPNTFQAKVDEVRRAITKNTVMIAGTLPQRLLFFICR